MSDPLGTTADDDPDGFWVFAYGSLMWRPDFPWIERRMARIDGYARRFALSSIHYRGVPEAPGLVLGLDWSPGAACTGRAYRVAGKDALAVRDYLAARELVSRAYFEVRLRAVLLCDGPGQGAAVPALAYIVDRTHAQYVSGLSVAEQAAIIRDAEGPAGRNDAYLESTLAHLAEIGIPDPGLQAIWDAMRADRPDA